MTTKTNPIPITLPPHPQQRYQQLAHLQGLWIIHITPGHVIEGRLTEVTCPDLTTTDPSPTLTLHNNTGSITTSGRAGDLITTIDW